MKRLTKVAIAVVIVFVVMTTIFVFLLRPRGALPALPNPNGYDDLVKAGSLATGNFDDYKTLGAEGLRALLTTNAESFRIARIGLSRSCAVPTEGAISNNFANLNADLKSLRSMAKLFAAEGRLRELENRPGDAMRSYLDDIRLGVQLSRGGFLINRLVGIACEAIGSVPMGKLIPQFTAEQLHLLITDLEQIGTNYVSWNEIEDTERRCVYEDFTKSPNPAKLVTMQMTRSATANARQKHEVALAHLRLLTTEAALRCYQLERGQAAQKLEDLVPKYLASSPRDPFSETAMVYKMEGTNWFLYSLGTNRVDNGGLRGADLFFDSGW
jgi:hypothetical protein